MKAAQLKLHYQQAESPLRAIYQMCVSYLKLIKHWTLTPRVSKREWKVQKTMFIPRERVVQIEWRKLENSSRQYWLVSNAAIYVTTADVVSFNLLHKERRLRGNMNNPTTRPNESLSFGDIVTMITPRLKLNGNEEVSHIVLATKEEEKKWNYHLTMDRQQRKEEIQFLQLSCSFFFYRAHRSLSSRRDCEYKMLKWNHTYARGKAKNEEEKWEISNLRSIMCVLLVRWEKSSAATEKKAKKNVGYREADRLRITVCPSASLQSTRWALSYVIHCWPPPLLRLKKLKLKLFSIDDSFFISAKLRIWSIVRDFATMRIVQFQSNNCGSTETIESDKWEDVMIKQFSGKLRSLSLFFSSADFWVANSDVVTRLHVLMLNFSLLSIVWFTRKEWRSKSSEEAAKFSH